jgi:predicted lipoprotein
MEISTTTLAIFAVFAVMGLVGVVAVTILSVPEDAEAAGCNNGIAFNASKGRCFGH